MTMVPSLSHKSDYLKLFIIFVCMCFCTSVAAQDFAVTYERGHELTTKPSLSNRIQGASDIVLIVPREQARADQYYYACLYNYFRRIGAPIRKYNADFVKKTDRIGNIQIIWGELDDDISDSWSNPNTLLVVANCVSSMGYYTGEENMAQIAIIDPMNDFRWDLKFDMPNKEEKFDKKLRSLIANSYNFNPAYAHVPPYYKSNWQSEGWFKDYFNNGRYHPLEGVYEGDSEKVAVKKGNDGKFYLVYLGKESNTSSWETGDIKAVLEPTATPAVFKGTWFDLCKQPWKYTYIFKDGLMISFDEEKNPEQYIKLYPALLAEQEVEPTGWSGTGFALKNGYVVTNYHVIDGATSITIKGIKGDFDKSYNATVVGSDRNNDLALLKISDASFTGFGTLPYSIATSTAEVGEDIFVLGYPLTSTMGDEIKLTTGIISSKTGFQGDVSLYQISAPIQPGNSGGPLFNNKGNVVGVVSAKHSGAENVGYAIKSSYLRNLVESCASSTIIPTANSVSTLSLPHKVKAEKNFVFFIECSASAADNFSMGAITSLNGAKVINRPQYSSKGNNKLQVLQVILNENETVIEFSDNNSYPGGYYQWFSISPDAAIKANGVSYKLRRADGIALAPNVTYFSSANETKTFRLTFPAIPKDTQAIDFIEGPDSEWKVYGIKLN